MPPPNQNNKLPFKEHERTILKNIQIHFQRKQLCDVVLVAAVDGRKFVAHRVILSACSPYFSVLFNAGAEVPPSAPPSLQLRNEVSVAEINGDILEKIIDYCYTGCIEIKADNIECILLNASKFQMDNIVNACCGYLTKRLNNANCIDTIFFAKRINCVDLIKHCENFILQNFLQIYKIEAFCQLDINQLCKLIDSDNLNVAWEEDVFDAILIWVNFDQITRNQYFPQLLGLLRLSFLSVNFIVDRVKPICAAHGCLQLILDVLCLHLVPNSNLKLLNEQTVKPRINELTTNTVMNVIVRYEILKHQVSIECYSVQTNQWSLWKQNVLCGSRNFGWTQLNGKLYIVGGEDNHGTSGTAVSIDLWTKAVVSLDNLNTKRSNSCLAAFNNCIYTIGGLDSNSKPLKCCERYDPKRPNWKYICHLPQARFNSCTAVINDTIYVLGGEDINNNVLPSVLYYNADLDSWNPCTSMVYARSCASAVALNNYIYVVGGTFERPGEYTDTVERYNPATDEWMCICSLNIKGICVNCYELSGRLMALIINEETKDLIKTVKVYDSTENKWNCIESLIYECKNIRK